MHNVSRDEMWIATYYHIFKNRAGLRNFPSWRGVPVVKMPNDLLMYAQAIWKNKPDVIVETGTKWGGSALFFADMMELNGKGKVVTIDIVRRDLPAHPRVEYLVGRSTSTEIVEEMKRQAAGKATMVVLDSDHSRIHVKRELHHYAPLVSPGQHLVVEDVCSRVTFDAGPGEALDWFFSRPRPFDRVPVDEQFMGIGVTRGGWLRRR